VHTLNRFKQWLYGFKPLSGQAILAFIAQSPRSGREVIRRAVAPHASDTSIWRALSWLVDEGRLEVSGKTRSTRMCRTRVFICRNIRLGFLCD
jgi:hypothetical protein